MSPIDMCILFFFVGVSFKTLFDSFKFWEYSDELAILEAREAQLKARIRMNEVNKKAVRVTRTPNRPNSSVNSRPATRCRTEVLRGNRVPDRRIRKAA
ncbi:MAG: hypothetical protein MJ094_00130 [Saccharofermentans sp.]|nr:hypothetical protein [Saccharofermentans sp.]